MSCCKLWVAFGDMAVLIEPTLNRRHSFAKTCGVAPQPCIAARAMIILVIDNENCTSPSPRPPHRQRAGSGINGGGAHASLTGGGERGGRAAAADDGVGQRWRDQSGVTIAQDHGDHLGHRAGSEEREIGPTIESNRKRKSEELQPAATVAAASVTGAASFSSSRTGTARGTRAGGGNRGVNSGRALAGNGCAAAGDDGGGCDRKKSLAAATCEGCGGEEGNVRMDMELLEGFGVSVCRTCKVSRFNA